MEHKHKDPPADPVQKPKPAPKPADDNPPHPPGR